MSSTYSTNLAIELIGTGDQAGNWGSTTNTNLGTLIEQSISGVVTQAMSDADQTITIPNGASGVARNMFIECTGALTAARSLIVPTNKKLYFISNATTGGFAITVKVSGQTGVSVPMGAKVILVMNSAGTDIVVATNYMKDLTVGEDLTVGDVLTAGSIKAYAQTSFTATISDGSSGAGTILNVSAVASGTIYVGQYISGAGVTSGTQITGFTSGTLGGIGLYTVSAPSTVLSGTAMTGAAGATSTTVASTDNSTNIATTAFAKTAGAPTGSIFMWGTASAPTGFLFCNGTAVSRTTYSVLYGIISTTFGVGDGSTTFNLPNFNGSMPIGVTAGTSSGFTGSISGTTLTVATVSSGALAINQVISGTSATAITATSIVAGTKYQITTVGTTTTWSSFGGPTSPAIGNTFVATASGSGDGTAYPVVASGTTVTGYVSAGVYTVSISQTINSTVMTGTQSALALASTGGAATTGLTAASLPNHNHTLTDPGHLHSGGRVSFLNSGIPAGANDTTSTPGNTGSAVTGITIQNTGTNTAFSTISPYLGIYFIIKA
jgi:microcystin-dependent protein